MDENSHLLFMSAIAFIKVFSGVLTSVSQALLRDPKVEQISEKHSNN